MGTATYTGYGCSALTDSDGRGAETGMALDPTGRLPALRDGSRTRLRSLDTGGQVHELRHPGDVWWPFFSLDVTMLAVGTAADQAYVWELA